MPDQHSHSCHDEHHDGHTHSHGAPLEDIPRETLFSIIDHQNVMALNVVEQNDIIKPWDRRNDDEIVCIPHDASSDLWLLTSL
jgi:hypothetical protein